jgi:hypothetical protein
MLTAPPSSPDEAQQKHSADMLVFYLSKSIGLYSICRTHENLRSCGIAPLKTRMAS